MSTLVKPSSLGELDDYRGEGRRSPVSGSGRGAAWAIRSRLAPVPAAILHGGLAEELRVVVGQTLRILEANQSAVQVHFVTFM